jgi:hypothetical protein
MPRASRGSFHGCSGCGARNLHETQGGRAGAAAGDDHGDGAGPVDGGGGAAGDDQYEEEEGGGEEDVSDIKRCQPKQRGERAVGCSRLLAGTDAPPNTRCCIHKR